MTMIVMKIKMKREYLWNIFEMINKHEWNVSKLVEIHVFPGAVPTSSAW